MASPADRPLAGETRTGDERGPRDGASHLLVLGGARSGKSRFAQGIVETRAAATGRATTFVATAMAHDAEMEARIAIHVAERDARWRTVEAPYDLVSVLRREASPGRILLVDCLTLWLSNLMLRGDDCDDAGTSLAAALPTLSGAVVLVTNEVGHGIVPPTSLGRRFRDAQGRLNQTVASACETVVLVTAGLPTVLKPAPRPDIRL